MKRARVKLVHRAADMAVAAAVEAVATAVAAVVTGAAAVVVAAMAAADVGARVVDAATIAAIAVSLTNRLQTLGVAAVFIVRRVFFRAPATNSPPVTITR